MKRLNCLTLVLIIGCADSNPEETLATATPAETSGQACSDSIEPTNELSDCVPANPEPMPRPKTAGQAVSPMPDSIHSLN